MTKIIQLFKKPSLQEFTAVAEEIYNTEPDIYMLMCAARTDDGEQYEINYVFYADSEEDFAEILKNIAERVVDVG